MRALLSLCLVVTLGCATGPAVRTSAHLPVQSVVLYRNGVGYFERSGRFEGDELAFDVRRSDVGDFLSSLTVIERGEGGVRSISFDVPEDEPPAKPEPPDQPPPPPRPVREPDPTPEPAPTADQPTERMSVRLHLTDDEEHELTVAYVVGSPIWRATYRLVLDEGQPGLLQAWAVVQNTSGEDWENVELSLTTGAPIAFRSDLGKPIVPPRPLVTDEGEVITRVPESETAVEQKQELAADAAEAAPAPGRPEEEALDEARASGSARTRSADRKLSSRPGEPAPESAAIDTETLAGSVRTAARVSVLQERITRYDLERPVTVPDGGSTMVAILSTETPAEQAHLFAPDGGVPLSHQHPFSVARLVNSSGAVLERGPVSVLADGAFLGQGVLDTLPEGATAFVPFELDKSLVVESARSFEEKEGKLIKVLRDRVTVERFRQRETRYRIRNGSARATKVYVRHRRWREAELIDPPEGTELAPGKALVPQKVGAKASATLEVIERTEVERRVDFMSDVAAEAIQLWLSGPATDAAQAPGLRRALELREQLLAVRQTIRQAERRQAELQKSAEETRANLKAIEKVQRARDLRTKLVKRLRELDDQLGELTRELVQARTDESELEVRLDDALRDVSLAASE